MNYTENNIDWNVGDHIIHDCDAKRKNMLMRIVAKHINKNKQRRYVCAYIDRAYHMGQKGLTTKQFKDWNVWENSISPLHDPNRFDLK